jgi:hypothetical protein
VSIFKRRKEPWELRPELLHASDPLERFYTKPEVADQCVAFLDEIHPIRKFGHIVDPCCGMGAFVWALDREASYNSLDCFDIDPDVPFPHANYLEWSLNRHDGLVGPYLTIGNPPFSEYYRFISHAFEYSDWVAFILPRGIMVPNMVDKLDLRFDSFTFRGRDFSVATSFYVMRA